MLPKLLKNLEVFLFLILLPSLFLKENYSSIILFILISIVLYNNKKEFSLEKIITFSREKLFMISGLLLLIPIADLFINGYQESNPFKALRFNFLQVVLCTLFYYNSKCNHLKINDLFKFFSFSSILYCIFLLFKIVFFKIDGSSIGHGHVLLGIILGFNSLFSIYSLRKKKQSKITTIFFFVSCIISILTISLIGSRMALFATMISLVIMSVDFNKKDLLVLLCIVIFGVFSFYCFYNFNTFFQSRYSDFFKWNGTNPLYIKFIHWKCAVSITKENFWTGVGASQAQESLTMCYHEVGYWGAFEKSYHSHNQFVENFLRYGIMGLSSLLLFFIYLLRFSILKLNKKLFSIVVFIILINFTDNCLYSRHIMTFSIFSCLYLIYYEEVLKNN